jgi:MSHA biogenesis protein MshI
MLGWLERGGRTPGWLAVTFDEARLEFAHARRGRGRNVSAEVGTYAARELSDGQTPVERVARELKLGRFQCSTMLRAGEYDIVLVDAPNVPRAEMKSALRWKVKGMVDYPVEHAMLDFLAIPSDGAAEGRSQQIYAVLARSELLQARVRKFDEAGIPLSVIDIPDTAQRNIAALYGNEGRGVALLYFGRNLGLLTISHGADLYLTRRLELGVEELAEDADAVEGGAHERVVLEVQRTLDHFERQFRNLAVAKLLLAPSGRPTRLREILGERFEMPLHPIDLTEVLAFGSSRPPEELQWRLFHHFGAALRDTAA